MNGWGIARKKPIEVQFREVQKKTLILKRIDGLEVWGEVINTREGQLVGHFEEDYIIRGVQGEEYPIKKEIFDKTYDVIRPPENEEAENR